jgi:hypothetical protein
VKALPPQNSTLSPAREQRFWEGAAFTSRFFMGQSDVQLAMRRLGGLLDELQIPHAIIGAMALNEYGYVRATTDVDVLLTREGLAAFKVAALGHGYVEKFPGSRGVRDTVHGVTVDVVLAGDYPGDGKPKPVRFPDPALEAQRGQSVSLLPLHRLVELKLASGISAPHRGRDLVDVQELIRAAHLERSLADQLDPSVRSRYLELHDLAQVVDPLSEG